MAWTRHRPCRRPHCPQQAGAVRAALAALPLGLASAASVARSRAALRTPWRPRLARRPGGRGAHARRAGAQAQLLQQLAQRGMAAGATALRKPDLVLRLAPVLQAEACRAGQPGAGAAGRNEKAAGGDEFGADVGASHKNKAAAL